MPWGTKRQHELAFSEGWEIFEADGSQANRAGNWPYQVQKCDEEAILKDDDEAHKIIVEGALKGKTHHLAVLVFLRKESKPELDLIYRSYLGQLTDEVNWEKSILTHDMLLDCYERSIFGRIITRTEA